MSGKKSWIILLPIFLGLLFASISFVPTTRATQAVAAASVTVPSMKLPWDANRTDVTYNSGPHGNNSLNTRCDLEPQNKLSGLDFGMPENTPVLAVADGTVVYANQYYDGQLRGVVIIQHANGFMTEYWHLNTVYTALFGFKVHQGTVIGLSGWSPCSNCSDGKSRHLHLEFRATNSTTPPTPYSPTPYPAHGLTIDGYTAWSLVPYTFNGNAYNYQGTLTTGPRPEGVISTYGAVTGDTTASCRNDQVIVTYVHYGCCVWTAGDGVAVPSTNLARSSLKLEVSLDGIGTDTAHGQNNNPRHPQRANVTVHLTSPYTIPYYTFATISYSTTTGTFRAIVDLGTYFPTENYTVQIVVPHALSKTLGGFYTITNNAVSVLPSTPLLGGDINGDNTVDILDYNILLGCYGSKKCPPNQKAASDINDDGKVDGTDYNILVRNFGQSGT